MGTGAEQSSKDTSKGKSPKVEYPCDVQGQEECVRKREVRSAMSALTLYR